MKSLISPDNTWFLWAIIVGWAAISIYLEQKYSWASKVSGAIIALLGAMILANFNIIPTESPVYDNIWGYVVPMAIPLLLFKCNITKIWKESGRLLLLFCIGSVGTVIGCVIGFHLLKSYIPALSKAAAMIGASYIGGSVNFVAMADALAAPKDLVSTAVVADNLLMALYFFVLIAMPSVNFFITRYAHPYVDKFEENKKDSSETVAATYWGKKEISLKDIAFCFACSVGIVAVSTGIADLINAKVSIKIIALFFGNKYLIITTITMLLATFLPNQIGEIRGSQEIGTFLIYIFFVVIGVPASIMLIIEKSPLLLVFSAIVVIANMLIIFIIGKLLKFSLEECILASNANIGGPTTAAAMAISKGWTDLVGPSMLVGTFGYVIANYLGLFMANILK